MEQLDVRRKIDEPGRRPRQKIENNQPKSNFPSGRGGRRQGAGRKPGSANTKTRAIADKAAAEGKTPLDVMLETMTAFVDEAGKIGAGDSASRLKLLAAAANVAKDAAPYMHPRLQAIEHSAPTLTDQAKYLTDAERASRVLAILERARMAAEQGATTQSALSHPEQPKRPTDAEFEQYRAGRNAAVAELGLQAVLVDLP